MSDLARSFISGLLRHGPELTLVTNQWVNSYKRLVAGYEAPVYVSWASINRSDLVRIPAYKEGREDSVRAEYRAPDPACNPYLAFSVLLAAGLAGIKNAYPVPAPVEENLFEISEIERKSRNIEMLPGSLLEAIQLSESSSLVEKALGKHLYRTLLTNKRIEWERYRPQITDFELRTYLPSL